MLLLDGVPPPIRIYPNYLGLGLLTALAHVLHYVMLFACHNFCIRKKLRQSKNHAMQNLRQSCDGGVSCFLHCRARLRRTPSRQKSCHDQSPIVASLLQSRRLVGGMSPSLFGYAKTGRRYCCSPNAPSGNAIILALGRSATATSRLRLPEPK